AQLLALDERMLHDIGLARGDVADAMSLPVGQDAGAFLEDRRRARLHPSGPVAIRLAVVNAVPAAANETRAAHRAA
ncbi:MAG: DUF1127 domain-containing protein, partial [Myxococcota bacterium]|nr:DUF1127 domain-containing protein [Myxococcota bacterium]